MRSFASFTDVWRIKFLILKAPERQQSSFIRRFGILFTAFNPAHSWGWFTEPECLSVKKSLSVSSIADKYEWRFKNNNNTSKRFKNMLNNYTDTDCDLDFFIIII